MGPMGDGPYSAMGRCIEVHCCDFRQFETVCLHPWVRVPAAPPVLILVLAALALVTLALAIVFWNSFHGIVAIVLIVLIVLWTLVALVSIPFAIARPLADFARLAIFPSQFAIDLWRCRSFSDTKLSVHRPMSFDQVYQGKSSLRPTFPLLWPFPFIGGEP